MAAADSRPKCPVCGARVGDAAARDPGPRQLVPHREVPPTNPERAARAAALRAKNAKAGRK